MSVLNNEGHDPQGFGNTPARSREEFLTKRVAERGEEIERLRERCEAHKGQVECGSKEIARLRAAISRIDAINDNPACYNPAINEVCDSILRPHLAQQPGHEEKK